MSPKLEEALPKYVQVATYIRDQITRGELQPGEEVPRSARSLRSGACPVPRRHGHSPSCESRASWTPDRASAPSYERSLIYRRALDRYVRSRTTGRMHESGTERDHGGGLDRRTEGVALALGLDPEAMVIAAAG